MHPSLEHYVLTQYKQILLVVEYENQREYEYLEFRHIYKNDFPIFQLLLIRLMGFNIPKWDAPSRWSFRPISAWGSIKTTTMRKTHPSIEFEFQLCVDGILVQFYVMRG